LTEELLKFTGISRFALGGRSPQDDYVAKRISWLSSRTTTRLEDQAYCAMGLLDINMPLLYGEGEKAFRRLQEGVIRQKNDYSIFAWAAPSGPGTPLFSGPLASSPSWFSCWRSLDWGDFSGYLPPRIDAEGIQLQAVVVQHQDGLHRGVFEAYLNNTADHYSVSILLLQIGTFVGASTPRRCFIRVRPDILNARNEEAEAEERGSPIEITILQPTTEPSLPSSPDKSMPVRIVGKSPKIVFGDIAGIQRNGSGVTSFYVAAKTGHTFGLLFQRFSEVLVVIVGLTELCTTWCKLLRHQVYSLEQQWRIEQDAEQDWQSFDYQPGDGTEWLSYVKVGDYAVPSSSFRVHVGLEYLRGRISLTVATFE
jgi:hypothetical protein